MAVFTAISTALLTAAGVTAASLGSAFAFNLAVGVVAMGLAAGTAKLFGIFDMPKMGDDPGVKIQLPPATDNKVPRLYGRNFTGGIIIDAEIKEQNKKMTYALVISEYREGDVWTVNKIYRDDKQLVFGTGAKADTVQSTIDANQTSAQSWRDTFRVRVYAGNAFGAKQVFPAGQNDPADNLFDNWTIANVMEDLVFAVVEVLYNDNQDVFGLGAFTFDMTNSVSEPGNVLLDYLTSDRYGPGISSELLDLESFNDWYDVSKQQVGYYTGADVYGTHDRWQINGALGMFDSVKQNITKVCQNGGAFFTYNSKIGKFGVVPLRAATQAEKDNTYIFNSKNIVSKVTVSSTELFSLFNSMEVEYPSVAQRDQTSTLYIDTPAGERHPNEPDNKLTVKLEMVNSRSRAYNLANIDLKQSRLNTIIQFSADYSALQVNVGDVVKVTLAEFGWNNKLFRAMRQRELEDLDGLLTVEMTLLEYSDAVYDHVIITDDPELTQTNIPDWYHIPYVNQFGLGNIQKILVVNDPTADAAVVNPVTGSVQSLEELTTLGPYAQNPQVMFQVVVPTDTVYDTATVVARGPDGSVVSTVNAGAGNTFTSDSTVNVSVDVFNFGTSNVNYDVFFSQSGTGLTSNVFTTGNIASNVANVINTVKLQDLAVTTAKIQDLNVNTLKIANNSITVPISVSSSTPVTMTWSLGSGTGGWPWTASTAWTTLLSTQINLDVLGSGVVDTDIPLLLTWSAEGESELGPAGRRYFRLIKSVGGVITVLYVTNQNNSLTVDQFISGIYLDTINAGTNYQYAIQALGESTTIFGRNMWFTAARR